jgi:hypothetical protein
VPVVRGFGAGSLDALGGGKIGFTFEVSAFVGGQNEGRLRLHDQKAKHRIEIGAISTASAPAMGSCGAVQAGAPHSIEFTASGSFDGAAGHTFHVCAQDNGDPGRGADILHLDCATCPYNTTSAAAGRRCGAATSSFVRRLAGASSEQAAPAVIVLEPALGTTAPLPIVLTATALDRDGIQWRVCRYRWWTRAGCGRYCH